MNEAGLYRTSNRAGGGAFTKGGVSCTMESVHSHMPRQGGEKEQAWVQFLESIVTKVALYLHRYSRTALAMRFNGPIRWNI